MKRIVSVLLCIVMLAACVLPVYAESENTAEVLEFLVAPGQYTNMTNFGVNIENTINGKSAVTSLGNFGGYVIYKFSRPIMNSDNNACGIDFVVNGNAFNGSPGAAEPGQVWVSQNGEEWYALAGSEHYENETIWDYSVTYIKPDDYTAKCNFTDSLGDSGVVSTSTASRYPESSVYTTVNIPENNLTLSGVLLKKSRIPSTAVTIETQFGYVDSKLTSNSSVPSNPYLADPVKNCKDGQFDISWAVDKNGLGVSLDWIKYIKVQTACFIDSSAFGEKSTEISSVMISTPQESEIEKTQVPDRVVVNGSELDLSGGNIFLVPVEPDTPFDVSVESDANVYINNTRTLSKHFDSTTNKGVIRIIVQKDNLLPLIYYIVTGATEPAPTVTISESIKKANVGEIFTLKASSSDGSSLTWKSSDDDIAVVENGRVIVLSEGTATITATNDRGVSASCEVIAVKAEGDNRPDINECTCNCHKTGFMSFIWKIINFFNRLFRNNQYCECGTKHW